MGQNVINGHDIYRIAELYDTPLFAKEARLADLNDPGDLTPSAFADPSGRLYRIDSPEATWWSAARFLEKSAQHTAAQRMSIEGRIQDAAAFFGIGGLITDLKTSILKSASCDESQLPNESFGLIKTAEDGTVVRQYPLRNAGEVKAAAAYVQKHVASFPFAERQQMAGHILVKASEYGVGLDNRDNLECMAGLGLCSGHDVATLLRQRMQHVGQSLLSEVRDGLTKVAADFDVRGSELQHPSTLFQAAELIDSFDRANGLTVQYGTRLQPPETVLFSITEKVAADLSKAITGSSLTGNFYNIADLERIPMSDLTAALGEDVASHLGTAGAWVNTEKLAAVLPTLPLSDALAFDSVASSAGIAPFATKAASWVTELNDSDLVALAASYDDPSR